MCFFLNQAKEIINVKWFKHRTDCNICFLKVLFCSLVIEVGNYFLISKALFKRWQCSSLTGETKTNRASYNLGESVKNLQTVGEVRSYIMSWRLIFLKTSLKSAFCCTARLQVLYFLFCCSIVLWSARFLRWPVSCIFGTQAELLTAKTIATKVANVQLPSWEELVNSLPQKSVQL